MKKKYTSPDIKVIELNQADIIATSGTMNVNDSPYENDIIGD